MKDRDTDKWRAKSESLLTSRGHTDQGQRLPLRQGPQLSGHYALLLCVQHCEVGWGDCGKEEGAASLGRRGRKSGTSAYTQKRIIGGKETVGEKVLTASLK